MASSGPEGDTLQRELSCPICMDLFICPLLLPCGHTFCKKCLKNLVSQKDGKDTDVVPTTVKSQLACPTCRQTSDLDEQGIDALTRNFLLENIIERHGGGESKKLKKEIVRCGVCESGEAEKSCTVCRLSYCPTCLPVVHPNKGGFTYHRLVAATNSPTPGFTGCPTHEGEMMKMYCSTCRKPLCYLCDRFGGHQQHNVSDILSVFQQEKTYLGNEADTLTDKNKILASILGKVQQSKETVKDDRQATEVQVQNKFARIRRAMNETEQRVLQEIRMKEALVLQRLESCSSLFQDTLNTNIGTVELIQQAIRIEDREPFLLSVSTLRDRIRTGIAAFDVCSKTPVKTETSVPLNINTQGIYSNLSSFGLGFLQLFSISWNTATMHRQLMSDERSKMLRLKGTPVPEDTSDTRMGRFNGPSLSAMGCSVIANSNRGVSSLGSYCKFNIINEEHQTADDPDIDLVLGLVANANKQERLETQAGCTNFLMTFGKNKKENQYSFVRQGRVVKTLDLKVAIDSVYVVVDKNTKRIAFLSEGKMLHVFEMEYNIHHIPWYPAAALYTEKYKVVVL